MNNNKNRKWKDALQRELKQLEKELQSVGHINPANPKDWEALPDKIDAMKSDPNEVADKIESYEGNTAILKQLEIRLNEVKGALKRMEDGTYGKCQVCGKEIRPERLEANPAAATCIEHAS